jgi:hypothetical protein
MNHGFGLISIEELQKYFPEVENLGSSGITVLKAHNEYGEVFDNVWVGFEDGTLKDMFISDCQYFTAPKHPDSVTAILPHMHVDEPM